jgi:hypothetical protein
MSLLLAFDPENPPVSPPPLATRPMLWSLARQVFGDHDVPEDDGRPPVPRCATCGRVWPCPPRLLAEHGLLAACAPLRRAGSGVRGPTRSGD